MGRRRLVDVLVAVGEAAVPWALKMLEDQRWYVVRNMVTILGGIGAPEGLRALVRLSRDPDSRIRKEVARVLGRPGLPGSAETERHLLYLLDDPDMAVRLMAISAAASSRSSRVLDAMWKTFRRIPIWSKHWELKASLLRALGYMGLEERLVPHLASIVRKRPLLWRRRWETVQRAAIQALGASGAPGAKVLCDLREHENPETRRAVARAFVSAGECAEGNSR
jgi:HEAT repeat protein